MRRVLGDNNKIADRNSEDKSGGEVTRLSVMNLLISFELESNERLEML